jgi:hypothetical protein
MQDGTTADTWTVGMQRENVNWVGVVVWVRSNGSPSQSEEGHGQPGTAGEEASIGVRSAVLWASATR